MIGSNHEAAPALIWRMRCQLIVRQWAGWGGWWHCIQRTPGSGRPHHGAPISPGLGPAPGLYGPRVPVSCWLQDLQHSQWPLASLCDQWVFAVNHVQGKQTLPMLTSEYDEVCVSVYFALGCSSQHLSTSWYKLVISNIFYFVRNVSMFIVK